MIRFCTCTAGSSSSPVNCKHREGSKTCKSCGGKLSSDGHVVLSGSMLSTLRLEHSRVIDPHLNWKTASKGRQRAVRRARTLFTRINRNSTSKSLKENEDLTDKDSKRTGGMAVSESEKLGVSILGRRFSDNLGSIPIKKRRFLVVRSPSPPPQSSSHSDDSVQIREIESASHEEAASNAKQHAFNINSGVGIKSGQEISLVREKTNLEDLNEKLCDSVDFSGISILAAAACDGNIGGDVMNVEGSVSEEAKLEEKEEQIHLKEALDGKTNIPPEASKMFQLAGDKSYGTKVDGSCNLDTSMSSLQNVPNKVESSSRDDRLHWDLNTVMDVWDNHSEVPNSEPLAANIVDEVHDEKPTNVESHQDQMGLVDTKCASQFVNSRDFGCLLENNCGLKETKLRVEPVVSGDSSVAGHNEGKECLSIPCGDDLVEEEHELEGASIAIVDASEETKPLHDEKKSSFSAGGFFSQVRDDLVPTRDSSLATAVVEEEKADAHPVGFGLLVESEVSHSLLVPYENSSFSHIPHTCRPHAVMDQIAKVLCEKKTVIASAADLDDFSIQYRPPADVHTRQSAHLRSSEAEKDASLCNDSGSDNTDRYSVASHLFEEASGEMVDGDICKDIMKTAGVSGESAHSNALDKTDCFSADKFREANMITFPSDSHAFNSQMSSNHDERSSGGACVRECEAEVAEMKMPNNKCSVLIDETLETTKAVSPSHSDYAVPICNSEQLNPGMVDVHPLDGALNSRVACKGYGDGYATSNGQVALEDHSDCDYYSDTSQMDTDQPTGMEKVDFLGDEDYQYEDGEFRESFVNSWGEDVAEEGETEYVDYGSDNRELDIFEAASDVPPGVPEQVDGVEGKTARLLDGNEDMKYGAVVAKEMQHFSQTLLTCSSEAGSAKRRIGDGSKRLEADAKDASDSGEVSNKVIGQREFLNEGNALRKSSHLATLKSSGWDQLPEGCRGSGSVVLDSGAVSDGRNHADPSNAAGSLRRMVGSYRRDLPSRVENQKTSNASHRKDKFYVRESRANSHNDLDSRVERDTGAPRSIGRGGSSLHMRGRGSHNHWVESSDYRSTGNHDSRGCYGPDSITNPASKNAAAAAVAKLESNGFVVAADGTILKAGSVRSASRVPGRSTKASSLCAHRSLVGRRSSTERDGTFGRPLGVGNSKETSPDRHINADHSRASAGRCGPGMVTTGDRERHHHSMPDDIRDAPLPLHHQLSRREQSFSPHRRPLHRSRTRSGSRSPQMSHRGRNDGGMKSGPGLCLRGRSPNLSEVRTRRLRSPHRRSGLMEHMVGHAPSSRNYTSPPHASKWVDERKDLPYRFRQHEPNRFSGRSPPRRVFSRNHRLDPMDSPGRANLNECYRSKHSGTFPEFVDFDRGYDGPGDDRKVHSNRYEMLRSARQYDTGGNMKRFGYVAEDGFRVHNPRSRSSEFQRMGSPRAFENQLGGSPRRVKRRES